MMTRFRVLMATAAAVFLIAAAFSYGEVRAQSGHASAGATQSLTLTGTAQTLTVPTGTVWATLCLEVANARWRDDGTAPTTTVGVPLLSGQCMQYGGPFGQLQLIAQSGSPVVTVAYYR